MALVENSTIRREIEFCTSLKRLENQLKTKRESRRKKLEYTANFIYVWCSTVFSGKKMK